jgi:hypothetical protein
MNNLIAIQGWPYSKARGMSAFGTKQTSSSMPHMSALGGKADVVHNNDHGKRHGDRPSLPKLADGNINAAAIARTRAAFTKHLGFFLDDGH